MLVCAFLDAHCTRDRGCSAHPVFPAPSDFWRDNEMQNLGRLAPREREVVSIRCHSGAMRSIEPGSSRFRVWSFGPSRNDGSTSLQARRQQGVLLPRTLHEPTSTGRRRGTRAQRPARMAHAGADRTGRPLAWTECRILQCSNSKEWPLLKGQWQSSPLLCIGAAGIQASGPGTSRVLQK
jgi:hypothetical protein